MDTLFTAALIIYIIGLLVSAYTMYLRLCCFHLYVRSSSRDAYMYQSRLKTPLWEIIIGIIACWLPVANLCLPLLVLADVYAHSDLYHKVRIHSFMFNKY